MSSRAYRLRPAPRGRGRRRATRVHWDKLGRVVLVLVIFAVFLSYINPVVNFVDAWSDARAERAALAEAKAENAKLRERLKRIQAPDATERAARRLGMVVEGERAYVIRGLGREQR
jgi:cell division protein FtsB